MTNLDIRKLPTQNTASASVLTAHAETASAMLWQFNHQPTSTLGTWERSSGTTQVAIHWDEPSPEVLETYGNEKDATEEGAYAVAIAAANARGYRVIGRIFHGSGADWVMVPVSEPPNDYYKLEVSGMGKVGREKPEARLASKVKQGSGGDLKRPGMAVVVRFADVRILSEDWP